MRQRLGFTYVPPSEELIDGVPNMTLIWAALGVLTLLVLSKGGRR